MVVVASYKRSAKTPLRMKAMFEFGNRKSRAKQLFGSARMQLKKRELIMV